MRREREREREREKTAGGRLSAAVEAKKFKGKWNNIAEKARPVFRSEDDVSLGGAMASH